jgi:PAS domain S-box-containing protein
MAKYSKTKEELSIELRELKEKYEVLEKKYAYNVLSTEKETESLYKNIFDTHVMPKLLIDPKSGAIIEANEMATSFYGWSYAELCQMNLNQIHTALSSLEKEGVTIERTKLIQKHQLASGEIRDVEVYASPLEINGRRLAHLNIDDITERRKTEEALRSSEAKLKAIIDSSPDSINITDLNGNLLRVSPKTIELFGYEKVEQFINRNISDFITPEDFELAQTQIAKMHQGIFEGASVYKAMKADGSIIYIDFKGGFIRDENKNPLQMIFVIRDVTEHVKMQKSLRNSENKLRNLVNSQTSYVLRTDLQGQHTYWNNKFLKDFGWLYEENGMDNGNSLLSICDHHHQATYDAVNRCIAEPGKIVPVELDKPMFNGGIRTTLWEFVCLTNEDNFPHEIQCMGIDISKRKKIDQQLKYSEEKFKALYFDSPDAYLIIHDEVFIECNKAAEQLLHSDKSQIIGKSPSDFSPEFQPNGKKSDKYAAELFQEIFEKGKSSFEWTHITFNGDAVILQIDLSVMFYQDKQVVFTIWRDITEKKLAEQKLRRSEEQYRNLVHSINDIIYELDEKANFTFISPSSLQVIGYTEEEVIGKSFFSFIYPEDLPHLMNAFQNLPFKKYNYLEYRYIHKDNSVHWGRSSTTPHIAEGTLIGASGIFTDVTERKVAEIELKKREAELNYAQEIAQMSSWDFDMVTRKIVCSKNYFSLMRVPADTEMSEQLFLEWVHPEDIHRVHEKMKEIRTTKKPVSYDVRYRMPDNEYRWIQNNIVPEFDNEQLVRLKGVNIDVTEEKLALEEIRELNDNLEQKVTKRTMQLSKANLALTTEIEVSNKLQNTLIESERKHSSMIANISDVIAILGNNGEITYASPNIEKYFGWKPKSLIGTDAFLTVQTEDLEHLKNKFLTVLSAEHTTAGFEFKIKCKDGSYKPAELTATNLLKDPVIKGILLNFHDITERKLSEQELKKITSRSKLAIRAGKLGVWEWNVVQNKLHWDEQMFKLYGVNEKDFTGDYEAWQGGLHPDDKVQGEHDIKMALSGEKEFDAEFRVVWPDGSVRFIKALAVVNRDDSGKPISMIGTSWDITSQKRTADFERVLVDMTPSLTRLSVHNIDGAIQSALSRIGVFLNADRVYIFEFDADLITMNNTYEYCKKGINSEIENLQGIPVEIFPKWMKSLRRHEYISIPSVKNLPESWQAEREILEAQGVQSVVVIPILSEDKLIGFIGLDSVHKEKEYPISEINVLKLWSAIIASLINNQRSEKLVAVTRKNYETFFNSIDDYLFILDFDGTIINANDTVHRRLGYPPNELINTTVLNMYPEERKEEAKKTFQSILNKEIDFYSIPIYSKTGDQIPVETRVKEGLWNGKPQLFMVSKDISAIKLSEEKFAKAFHSNSVLMSVTTKEGKFIEVNDSFISTLEFSREEIIGNTALELGFISKKQLELIDAHLSTGREEIISAAKPEMPQTEFEISLKTKLGDEIFGLVSRDIVFIGSEMHFLTVIVNITERKRAEEKLELARMEADKANLTKSEFLSRMSHELRTPMNSILGFAQLLEMSELTQRQKRGVSHIMKSGKHLLDLINEVLDLSKIESGNISLSIEPVLLHDVIMETVDIISLAAKKREIEIEVLDAATKSLMVNSDKQALKQILLNLLNNAIKYNREKGSVKIKTALKPIIETGVDMIKISIIDTGLGILPKDLSKIFKPFQRIGNELSTVEGTGLGLAVVKKIITALGGTFGVESVEGEGSCFWIEIPCANAQSEMLKESLGYSDEVSNQAKKTGTILYIEDNASNIELVKQIIHSQKDTIHLITKMYGKEGLRAAVEYLPDLILLDLDLPDIHGSEVLAQLKSDATTFHIPVVIISANAMHKQIESLLNEGAVKYLTKPLDVKEFINVLDEFLSSEK